MIYPKYGNLLFNHTLYKTLRHGVITRSLAQTGLVQIFQSFQRIFNLDRTLRKIAEGYKSFVILFLGSGWDERYNFLSKAKNGKSSKAKIIPPSISFPVR